MKLDQIIGRMKIIRYYLFGNIIANKNDLANKMMQKYKIAALSYIHREFIEDNIDQKQGLYQFGKSRVEWTKHPHSLFFGRMGSGKTIAARDVFYKMILNNPNDVFFVLDGMKMAYEFHEYSSHDNTFSIVCDSQVDLWVDLLYQEFLLRLKKPNNPSKISFSNVHILFEDAHYFMSRIKISTEYLIAGTKAYKIYHMLQQGGKYGFFLNFVSQFIDNDIFPAAILNNVSNHLQFRSFHTDFTKKNIDVDVDVEKLKIGECFSLQSKKLCNFDYIDRHEYQMIFNFLKKKSNYNMMMFHETNVHINNLFALLSKEKYFEKILLNPNISSRLLLSFYQLASNENKELLKTHKNWQSSASMILDAINS